MSKNQVDKIKFPLSELEEHFKYAYQHGGDVYLKKPMSYHEYQQLDAGKRRYYHDVENFHEKVSVNQPGNTIKDPGQEGDNVDIVFHGRYSYPIMHNHNYIEMFYVYRGDCFHYVENQQFALHTGDMIILAPNAMHAIAVENDETMVINFLMSRKLFDHSFLNMLKGGKVLSGFIEQILYQQLASPYILFTTGEDPKIIGLINEIIREHEKKDYLFQEIATLYVKQLFIHLIRHYEMSAVVSNPIENKQDNNIVALLGYISVNYNNLTLKQLADFFGYNEIYLGKILQKYTGRKFNEIIDNIQMENAKVLLEEKGKTITEISHEVGCYDSSHFTHKFKKTYGMTPMQYRKQFDKI